MTYLENSRKLFAYYRSLGEKAMDQVTDQQLFFQPGEHDNSIAIIVQHMAGNMLSRFTDFLTEDGEKPWRDRDREFETVITGAAELRERWNDGWACFENVLNGLQESDLDRIVYIRNEGHTVLEAINRQLAHYAYHVGQLVYLARLLSGDQWVNLSIPKNRSQAFNREKFSKDKSEGFFTDKA